MKVARVAVLGVALGAGVIAAVLALNLSGPARALRSSDAAAPTGDADQVLVAAKDIPMGATLDDGPIVTGRSGRGTSSPPISSRRETSPTPSTQVVGAIVRATFFAGEPISEAKLVRSDRGFMSAILPAGKRAVATKISADTSAGGFILPNDRVDVIMTRRVDRRSGAASGDEYLTETILNNVRVLAIDQTIEEQERREGRGRPDRDARAHARAGARSSPSPSR